MLSKLDLLLLKLRLRLEKLVKCLLESFLKLLLLYDKLQLSMGKQGSFLRRILLCLAIIRYVFWLFLSALILYEACLCLSAQRHRALFLFVYLLSIDLVIDLSIKSLFSLFLSIRIFLNSHAIHT